MADSLWVCLLPPVGWILIPHLQGPSPPLSSGDLLFCDAAVRYLPIFPPVETCISKCGLGTLTVDSS